MKDADDNEKHHHKGDPKLKVTKDPDEEMAEDEIFRLDDELIEQNPSGDQEEDEFEDSENEFLQKPISAAEEEHNKQVGETLIKGLEEYNEYRLGSVRYEKELKSRK